MELSKDLELISKAQEFEDSFFDSYQPSPEVQPIIVDKKYFMIQQGGGGAGDAGEQPQTFEDLVESMERESQEEDPQGGFDTEIISEEKPSDLSENVEYKGKKQRF